MRRYLLAAGLSLMWFVQVQNGGLEGDAPAWGIAAILGGRLLVDFVGAWVAVSVLQLVFGLGRLGLNHLRARRQREIH
jgi:hypothetical protein